MSRVRGLQMPQKIVLVIGLAAAFLVVGLYVATDGFRAIGGGWFAYAPAAPTTDTYLVVRHDNAVRALVLPVALAVTWTIFSVWLLGITKASDAG